MIGEFDKTRDGRQVHKATIGTGALKAQILTYGLALQDVRLAGVPHSLTVGFNTLAPYEGDMFHAGTVVGPVVNTFVLGHLQTFLMPSFQKKIDFCKIKIFVTFSPLKSFFEESIYLNVKIITGKCCMCYYFTL